MSLVSPMLLCIKGVLPPVEWSTSSFPHFLRFCKAPSRRLAFPKDCHTNECDYYDKFLVSTVTGQYGPFLTLLLSRSTNPFTLHSRQRAFYHIDATELEFSLSLTHSHCFLTRSDPYRIRSQHLPHEHVDSQQLFSQFSLHTKTLCFIQIHYLQRFHVFSTRFPHLRSPCLP
jgi:hypothetical protein